MRTFYIDLLHVNEDLPFGVATRASSMEDALLQVRAFNHGHTSKAVVERISAKPTRGVKYGEWE